MPSWKKVIISGSDASLNRLNISTALTASGLNYPSTDGTTGQAIVTDGSGNLSFTTITSGTTTDTGSLLTTASAAGSTITFEKGDGSTFDVTVSATATSADALVTASLAGSVLTFEKGDTSTFDIILPPGGYSGSNATAHLNQTVAAETWSFAHNLDDRYPVFTVFDSNGDIIVPNRVETVDTNNANIYFTTPRTGTVTAVIASSISQISSVTYNFTNETTVAVTHSLDTRNIHVSVYDENYALVIPESVTLDTLDTVVVTFPTAKSGTVVVAKGGHILSGSAVLAETASYIASSNVDGPLGMDSVLSASYAVTASYAENFNAVSASISALSASYIDFDLNPTVEPVEGRLVWNVDDGTLDLGLANATLQIGQEQYWYVRNNTASPIANGAGVMATGTLGASTRITAAPMVADGTVPAKFFLGVATEEIAAGADGYVTTFGKVRNIDTSLLPSGSVLWCDPDTPGGLTVDEPVAPNLKLPVAFVVSQKNNGSIAVRATTGVRLSNSHDVQITSASYGELLMQSGSIWINSRQLSGSYGLTGSLSATTFYGTFNGAISSSAQIASDISGSFVALSSSLESRVSTNEATIESLTGATGSYLLNTTDTLTGDLIVTGKITAQEFHTEFVSASIVYQSGSTKFGNTQDDNHNFTGSINVTGSVTATSFSGIFEGAISSSAQIASDISGSFTLLSSSLENRIVLNEATGSDHESRLSTLEGKTLISSSAQIATEISGAFENVSASLSSRVNSLESFSSSLDATFATDADLNLVSASVDALNAATSSYALAANISGSITSISSSIASDIADIIDGTTTVTSASYALTALTASYALNAGAGAGFPYSGSAIITGSLIVSQSFIDFTQATVISGSIFSGSFVGDGTGLTGLGYGDTKKLNQAVAATTWSFNHNMTEQYPTVTVYNDSNEVIQPTKIEAVSNSTLNLYFGIPTAGTAVAVVGGVALTQEAGFNRTLSQAVAATTWSFAHNLGQKYPQITVFDANDELIIPGKVEAVDQNNAILYFDTAQAGTVAATVGGTAMTASYADTLTVTDTLLSSQKNTDVDTGTETVATVSTSLYDGAFFDYVIKDSTGGSLRAGTVTAVWSAPEIQYTETSTSDIGDTSGVTLAVEITGSDAHLRATTTTDNWNIKAFVRAL